MAANTTELAKLTRKHRELRGLSEFYSCLYSDWDMFMSQFCEPNHQVPSLDTGRRNSGRNSERRKQREKRQRENKSKSRHSAIAVNTTDGLQLGATVSSNPALVSDKHTSHSGHRQPEVQECGHMESVTDDIKPVAGLPVKKRCIEGPKGPRRILQPDHSTDNRSSEVDGCRLRRRKHEVDVASVDSGIKPEPDDDVTAKRRRDRPRKCDVGLGDDSSVEKDIKPVIGTVQKCRRGRKPNQSGLGAKTGTKTYVEVDGEIAWARFEEQDVKPDLSSLDVNVEPGDSGMKSSDGLIAKRRRGRPRKCDVGRGDDSEVEDVKPVIGMVQRSRGGRKPKQSGLGAKTSTKNSVEVDGEIVWARFEEQDVKPDLSSLAVNVEPGDAGMKPGVDVTVKRQSRRLRMFGPSSEVEDITPVLCTMESNRKGRKSKKSRLGTKRKNSFEVVGKLMCTKSEEQDVKPDISSTSDVTVKRRSNRLRKSVVSNEDGDITREVGTLKKNRKARKRKQSEKNAKTGRKNCVEGDGEMVCTKFEEQDVKPDLRSLAAAAFEKKRRRSKRMWTGSPAVVTRSMYRIKQHHLSTAAAADVDSAGSRVSPARSTRLPPLKLLSPSQIKVEPES